MIKLLFDYLIPNKLRSNVIQYTYAKTFIYIAIVGLLAAPVFFFFYYFFIDQALSWLILIEIPVILISLGILYYTASLLVARELLILSLVILFFNVSLELSLLDSPSTYWLLLPPFFSIILGGGRSSLFWVLLVTVLICLLYYWEDGNGLFFLTTNYYSFFVFISVLGLMYVSVFIAFFAESGRIKGLALKYRAYHDPVTELYNRYTFIDQLELELKSPPQDNSLSLIKISIDNLQHIEETLGSSVADILLFQMAKRTKRFFNHKAIIARLADDRFGVIYKSKNNLDKTIKHLMSVLIEPCKINNKTLMPRVSVGIASCPENAQTAQDMLRYSHLALTQARYFKDNNIQFFDNQLAEYDRLRLQVQVELPDALEKNQFVLHFQPRFSVKSLKHITGMEVLLRWEHPQMGSVSPALFIPIAEEMSLISLIGDWVLDQALHQYQQWKEEGIINHNIPIAVNLSVQQLIRKNAFSAIKKAIDYKDFDPRYLELEITESIFIDEKEYIISLIQQLRDLGLIIALDDFGTGFSSFSYLNQIPLDILKIDKMFIDKLPENQTIVEAIIRMAHGLNLQVIAEGVETQPQSQVLATLGCDHIQGYYSSRPVSAEIMRKLLKEQ
ncbi:putative bifunctional diguanylate cyclase/phosphodiesterase [Legionella yabuuchiae]|uniref:putative bifunctional diguanylate cyclase/phosphodiesterase n=1 Tax=Legionella yabuuchiae TaxID=376727 RepID=UPI001055B1AF|nr:EAL domain-containing protein [Legionella yabuuchiae]